MIGTVRGWRPGLRTGFATLVCILLALAPLTAGGSATASEEPLPEPAAPASAVPAPTPSSTPTTTYNTKGSPFSLTISPTRLVLTAADSGTTQEVLVVNQGESTTHVEVQKRDFTGGRDGSLVFQDESEYSATGWVEVTPTSFDIEPGRSQTVTATVAVPADPAPEVGDHQVALVFLVPSGETEANVKINRGVATPVYVTVPGATDDSVTLSNLAAPGFSAGDAVTVTATVENTGNVHRDFRGDSALPIAGAGSTTFSDFTVARGTTRDISATWQPPVFCICELSVSVENADGVAQTQSVRVVVFPVIPVVIGLIVLVVVVGGLLLARRALRNARPKGGQRHASG